VRSACPSQRADAAYTRRVVGALRAGRDVWGEQQLASRDGPTYEGVRRHLHPLLLARAAKGASLTTSGVHYLALGMPLGTRGAGSVALHVADGSQVSSESATGRKLTVGVGAGGRERYGACRAHLSQPQLDNGYLPILETEYADSEGASYTQQSFAAGIPETRSLVSFIRLTADGRGSSGDTELRFTPSVARLSATGNLVRRGANALLFFSAGGTFDGRAVVFSVKRAVRTVYVAWLNYPQRSEPLRLDAARYEAARSAVATYWNRRLSQGAQLEVPEQLVADAARNLLIQNLNHSWRYSIGNQYEQFSFPESPDVAQVMGAWGFSAIHETIVGTALTRKPTPYPNWKMGEKLLASARNYEFFRRRAFIDRITPTLNRYVEELGRQIRSSPRGLLARERYSSDIPDLVYGLHSQAVVWQGLLAMSRVWAQTGRQELAARSRTLASRLERGLRRAVRESERTLSDGSLFVPARLLDREPAYPAITASRPGSYWNLVMPYAFASGLFPPGSREANGVLKYLFLHGSRFLGLVRAGAFSLYGRGRVFPTSGTDQVYGINQSRFLADNDRPDQLVLSLYGQLGAGMTPGTFVGGEGATLAPLAGAYYRTMYLPPNSASNAAFLETLRLLLVHEPRDRSGASTGLRLANATPRAWLRPGNRIAVRGFPTTFGPLTYSLESSPSEQSVRAMIAVPARLRPRSLRLRVRLPRPNRISAVTLNGRPFLRFNAARETVDLSGRAGRLELVVAYERRTR
jgi:hypothetical protein